MILEAFMILAVVGGVLAAGGAALLWWFTRRDVTLEERELQPLHDG
jgi:hypothetical protein